MSIQMEKITNKAKRCFNLIVIIIYKMYS